MKKILFVLLILLAVVGSVQAVWIWTPETGRWVNPRYAVKETPQEQYEWAESFFKDGDYKRALKEYLKLIRHFPYSSYAAKAQYGVAVCYEKLGKYEKAAQEYQKLIEKYPDSELIKDAREAQLRIGQHFLTTEEKGWFNRLFGKDNYERAADVLQDVVESAPFSPEAPQTQLNIAEAYFKRGDYTMAAYEYNRVVENYPNSPMAEVAAFMIAVCYEKMSLPPEYDQTMTDKALRQFAYFIAQYPHSKYRQEAEGYIAKLQEKKAESMIIAAKFYEKEGVPEAARRYYEEVIKKFPKTKAAETAKKWLSSHGEVGD